MSFDKKQHLDKDEIDLVGLFRSIWFYKFSLLFLFILSVPAFVTFSTFLEPKYKAETVFKNPDDTASQGKNSLLGNGEGVGLLGFLAGGSIAGNDSFYSEIRSDSFLKTVFLNNDQLDNQTLQKFCPLPTMAAPRYSLKSLLISLGLSDNRIPSESQKTSLLVECVNKMLAIDNDRYGAEQSSAYRLSITSKDPVFSANLANQIVEKYFIRHERNRDKNFQDVKKYLSKVISEAQLEYTDANKLMQRFKIKHTLLINNKPLAAAQDTNTVVMGTEVMVPASPFLPELNKEIANLSKLEKSLNQLNQARSNLSNLKQLDQDNIKAFISSTEVQGVFSRNFVTSISKIDDLSTAISFKNQEIKNIVSEELQSLDKQTQALEAKINKREEQTMQLMTIENRFQELALDVSKKKLIFEGLKDQLTDRILSTGLQSVERPILLTKAVPPFKKASPNRTMVVALGALFSIFVGIAYILIRQTFLRRIHTLSQVQNISRFSRCYQIKHKYLKILNEGSDATVISQSFLSDAKDTGKFGCIIDISQKTRNVSLAKIFSMAVANLLAVNNRKIICLDTLPNKKPFSTKSWQDFTSKSDNINFHTDNALDNRVFSFNDEDGMISAGEIDKIKEKYSEYDKIICALDSDLGDLTKFNFIEQCDFYVLIGRSFQVNEHNYKKFSNTIWEKEKKCLGFFLID